MKTIMIWAGVLMLALSGCGQKEIALKNENLNVQWKKGSDGWQLNELQVLVSKTWTPVGTPSGRYTLLFSENKPDTTSTVFKTSTGVVFPEKIYRYQQDFWKQATASVSLNTAGQAVDFFPTEAKTTSPDAIVFSSDNDYLTLTATWTLDKTFSSDIVVKQHAVVKKDGYYSLSSPTLVTIAEKDMAWAAVPGYFQGNAIQKDFVRGYAYGQGVPERPVIYRERCVSTLTSIIDTKENVSFSVIPAPGLGRDPWAKDQKTHEDWNIGVSHKNRAAALSPSLYFPVLGENPSHLKAGDTLSFEFRYSLQDGNWYKSLNHAANDIYQFKKGLALRTNKESLMHRVEAMHHYLTDPKTSLWNVETFQGMKIGGQEYHGGVVGSQNDAIKNSDYGAMWMLANATGDPILQKNVLPYALNFKLAQQQTKPGFFQGAAMGQYYLMKRKIFVEEWGEFVEPISLTYYTMLDMGNILLFEPENKLLRDRLRLGADLLLHWQKSDGSWEVAYDQENQKPLFTDIQDLRPTFYGLIVAYRILKDEKYLAAAEKGATWLMKEGVEKGQFIGVCGDARYAPDFATAQTAQALLDLYDLTHKPQYRDAAIATARMYTTSIYTHPIPTRAAKTVKGRTREDWEIAQAGLGFEHGGIMGSAQRNGPIQLASHAGLFVRAFALTGDSLLIDMARASAIGRDAFVDSATHVASYYWQAMNKGSGPYPHHAWWQIGWITDYLMAEAQLRSDNNVVFPRGFVTPKVGPHQSYGFAAGKIYKESANLILREGLFSVANPNIECIAARATSGNRLFVVLLNDRNETLHDMLRIDAAKWKTGATVKSITELTTQKTTPAGEFVEITLAPYGLQVFAIDL
ncbi:glycerophosphoryl diester phosphodiesterase [Chryseolinea lacunae]|uniref:Glycerophosphoryl diester phosphodiesterase n=1 Tax=Chryseolinea lacunae TaxID=2801331 RepID=A0ABS1KUX8_9BACT|nr:glycerophosphoryl diester phosphodiesterase [Chryseolinea lacunae]MBL0743108.1 glycerophosphoryl diester phosphodiesterase [Chryseolinea lacunae]